MVFYGSFWIPWYWYFTKILKLMVFNGGFERRFLGFKKNSTNMFLRNGLVGKIGTLDKWLNRGFNPC